LGLKICITIFIKVNTKDCISHFVLVIPSRCGKEAMCEAEGLEFDPCSHVHANKNLMTYDAWSESNRLYKPMDTRTRGTAVQMCFLFLTSLSQTPSWLVPSSGPVICEAPMPDGVGCALSSITLDVVVVKYVLFSTLKDFETRFGRPATKHIQSQSVTRKWHFCLGRS